MYMTWTRNLDLVIPVLFSCVCSKSRIKTSSYFSPVSSRTYLIYLTSKGIRRNLKIICVHWKMPLVPSDCQAIFHSKKVDDHAFKREIPDLFIRRVAKILPYAQVLQTFKRPRQLYRELNRIVKTMHSYFVTCSGHPSRCWPRSLLPNLRDQETLCSRARKDSSRYTVCSVILR
jgi:hypothetical protein